MVLKDDLTLNGIPANFDVRIHAISPVTGQHEEMRLSMPAESPWEVLYRLGLVHSRNPRAQLADLAYERYRKIILP